MKKVRKDCLVAAFAIATVWLRVADAAAVEAQSQVQTQAQACESLTSESFRDFTVSAAALVSAGGDFPAYCRVTGIAEPRMSFEARLPASNWNGKFYQSGCGGFCGDFNPEKAGYSNTIGEALKRGYAAIMSNNGHAGYLGDASWAVGDETAFDVYAESGIPRLNAVGRALVDAFYGRSPERAYFAGCSNGGCDGCDGCAALSRSLRRHIVRSAGDRSHAKRRSVRLVDRTEKHGFK